MMLIKQLIEKLDEILLETKEKTVYLYEMSSPLGQVKAKVHSLSEQIIKHIIKVLLYGQEESTTLHHWSHELNTWLTDCMVKIKGKNRYPTSVELIQWLTDWYSDASDITFIRRGIENEYVYRGHKPRTSITNEVLYDSYVKILKDICPVLTEGESTDDFIQDVLEKYILA